MQVPGSLWHPVVIPCPGPLVDYILEVTPEAFPWGVRCMSCHRVIEPGQAYKNRNALTGKLSAGPCTEDHVDGVFCERC